MTPKMETITPPIANATNKVMPEARLFLDRSGHHLIPFDNQGLDFTGTKQAFVEAKQKAGRADGCRYDQDQHRIVQRTVDRIFHYTLPKAPGTELTPIIAAEGVRGRLEAKRLQSIFRHRLPLGRPCNHWWAREDSNLQPDRYERGYFIGSADKI